MSLSEEENIQIQYNVLGYSIDLHFYDYKLASETDFKFPNLLILEYLKSCFIEPSK